MFDIVKLPNTPRIARRLVDVANMGAISLDQNIIDLSKDDEGLSNKLKESFDLSYNEFLTTQFALDRNGRCIILESKTSKAKDAILAFLKIKEKFPIMFVTNILTQNRWVSRVCGLWPEIKVNVFGKFSDATVSDLKLNLAEHSNSVHFSSEPELGFDVYVTKPSNIYAGDLLKRTRFEQVIINQIPEIGAITRSNQIDIEHLCIEVESVIILVSIEQCKPQSVVTKIGDLDIHGIILNCAQILLPHSDLIKYFHGEHSSLEDELIRTGITTDKNMWLPLINVCTHLVKD